MKKQILFFLLLFPLLASAQTCITFQQAEKNGKGQAQLDSLYLPAFHADSTKAVFPGKRQDEFSKAWTAYFSGLMKYLAKNDFTWEKETNCFQKIYFSPSGKVEYWLYNFQKKDNVPEATQQQFEALLLEYSKKHRIRIKADVPFTQCATVVFYDVGKK